MDFGHHRIAPCGLDTTPIRYYNIDVAVYNYYVLSYVTNSHWQDTSLIYNSSFVATVSHKLWWIACLVHGAFTCISRRIQRV